MISIVIPCFNEEKVLELLRRRLEDAADAWGEWEAIVVDDGSKDATWELLNQIASENPRWKLIRFARNFGHQTAVSAGLAYAAGDAVVVLDADLQDPPEVVPQLIEKWRSGYDVVYAVRRKRKEGWLKRAAYFLFYRILGRVSDSNIPLDSGDFCLMDRKVVDVVNQMPEKNRFVRGLRAWVGFRQVGLEYERAGRAAGEPKYGLAKLVKLAVDGMLSFSLAPLRIATMLGLIVSGLAFAGVVFTLLQRIFATWFAQIGLAPAPGFATIVISILFLGGVQLVCLGILGEYLGRVYEEVKQRPLWVVSQTVGVEQQQLSIHHDEPVMSRTGTQ